MKRIFLLVITNLAVMLVLSVAAHLLGLDRYLAQHGQNLTGLLIMSAFFGFGGVSLELAKRNSDLLLAIITQDCKRDFSSRRRARYMIAKRV